MFISKAKIMLFVLSNKHAKRIFCTFYKLKLSPIVFVLGAYKYQKILRGRGDPRGV